MTLARKLIDRDARMVEVVDVIIPTTNEGVVTTGINGSEGIITGSSIKEVISTIADQLIAQLIAVTRAVQPTGKLKIFDLTRKRIGGKRCIDTIDTI